MRASLEVHTRVRSCVCICIYISFNSDQTDPASPALPLSKRTHLCTGMPVGVHARSPVEAKSWRVCGRPSSWPIQEHGKCTVHVVCTLHLEDMHAAGMHHMICMRPDLRLRVVQILTTCGEQCLVLGHLSVCNISPTSALQHATSNHRVRDVNMLHMLAPQV